MAIFLSLFLSAVLGWHSKLLPVASMQKLDKTTIRISGQEIQVEIADTEEKRSRGLSGRKNLPEDSGMLFLFELPAEYSFWMKDMRFSLDIIWIDENKKIVAISENISPNTYPNSFSPSQNVKYVLEVNAGWAGKNAVQEEDVVEF